MSGKFIFICFGISIVICQSIEALHLKALYDLEGEDTGLISSTDEVLVRRMGTSGLPVSLWPIPKRKSQGEHTTPILVNSMPAYSLVWLPGGVVKILPRNINKAT